MTTTSIDRKLKFTYNIIESVTALQMIRTFGFLQLLITTDDVTKYRGIPVSRYFSRRHIIVGHFLIHGTGSRSEVSWVRSVWTPLLLIVCMHVCMYVTTSAHCYRVYTGCVSLNELHSGWRYSPTAASMVQQPTTYPDNCSESLMSARGGDFVPRRPLHWSFHGLFEPPSVTGLSLLPRLQFGTAFQKQSVLQHLRPCSESHWKRHFSRDPTLTNV